MGNSSSSLLDETISNSIKGQAEAVLKEFSPYYRKQFLLARFSQVEDDLEQRKEKITQLLKQREAPEEGEVLYEDRVLYFDDSRKWKERYVVVRANHCLELHDSLEVFVRGSPPRLKLLPTGGAVLTTEEAYMALVDQCFPDDTNVKEDFGPPLAGMPGQFPVYLRLPYRTDSYFCFRQQDKQAVFLSILSDCIRHQNQDFLKKKTSEVQAFLKAIQLYRQDKDKYEAWGMLIGSDVRNAVWTSQTFFRSDVEEDLAMRDYYWHKVMANEVMEQLVPSLEVNLLPRLKAKKTEKRRVWFTTVEAAYVLVQEHLLDGLSALKEECRTSARQQEVLIHSDMDQILSSRRQLEEKVGAKVWAPAERLCSECVQPYLGSVLEELMEPVSSGFQEGRQLSERMMDRLCQDVPLLADSEGLRQALADMARPNLLSCYQKIGSLQDKLQQLQQRFGVSNITGVIHSAQIDLQQLAENTAYTFEQLLHKAVQDNPDDPGSAIEKAKHRVLKQYDYDSSTVRKRISREALVLITLPFIKKNLAPTCKTELQGLEQFIDADHSNFIHIENVYESVLLQSLDKEVTKVVKEAASLKKYNLFTDSRDLLSQSGRSSLSSPSVSTPGSPAMVLTSPSKTSSEPQSSSPLALNGHPSSPPKDEQTGAENGELKSDETDETVFETPLQKVEQILVAQSVAVSEEAEATPPRAEDVDQTVKAEAAAPVALETPAFVDSTNQSETQEVTVETAPETVIQEEMISIKTAAEPQIQSTDPPKEGKITLSETPTVVESTKTDVEAAAAQPEAPVPSPDTANEPVSSSAGGTGAQTASSSEEETHCERSEIKPEAPSGGQMPALPPADIIVDLSLQEAEPVNVSGQSSLDVSVGSESAPSDVESLEGVKTTQSKEGDKVSMTSDDANISKSPESSDDAAEDETVSAEPSPRVQTEAASGVDTEASAELSPPGGGDTEASAELSPPGGGDTEASAEQSPPVQTEAASGVDTEASVELSVEAADATTSPPAEDVKPSSPEAPLDCIKQIRDLVMEVIEVQELVQRYPDGVPNVEE